MVAKRIDNKFNFIKSAIENLPIPERKDDGKIKNLTFYDTKQKGLCIIVSYGGSKTFYLSAKIHGRPQRVKLGSFPDISIEQARKMAIENRNLINQGKSPNEEKKKLKQHLNFKELFNQYIEKHSSRNSKEKTITEYKRGFESYLQKIHSKKTNQITKNEIEKLHHEIFDNHGKYIANRTLSLIKAMFNKAIEWGYEGTNPAMYIKKFKEVSRDRYIKPEEMPRFFESLNNEPNIVLKNYFYIALFTGARKDNILSMAWHDIDFTLKEWRIPETKNGEPLKLPLGDEAIEILNELKGYQKTNNIHSDYIFYSKTSASKHLEEPKSAWKRLLERAGIKNLRIHDLRRTLGSYQAMAGSSLQIIGRSLGHKSIQSTQIYSRMSNDPVRESVKTATSDILKYAKISNKNTEGDS